MTEEKKIMEELKESMKRSNEKKFEFINSTASELLKELSEEDKMRLYEHPDYIEHHFGFGMYIRNHYIHGKELEFGVFHADDLSYEIFDALIPLIRAEIDE